MNQSSISVALLGIGGYGNTNVGQLLEAQKQEADPNAVRIVGAIDPSPASCRRLAELESRGVPLFESWRAFYASHRADLMIISTPIHLHARHVSAALERGSHAGSIGDINLNASRICDSHAASREYFKRFRKFPRRVCAQKSTSSNE